MNKVLTLTLIFLIIIFTIVIIYLSLPSSPLKYKFTQEVKSEISKCKYSDEVFTQEDFNNLPLPVQRYLNYSGYVGKKKMANARVMYDDVKFKLGIDKPAMKVKYQHYNFVKEPARIAFINTKLYGIPFEGRDKYQNDEGVMTGVLAKLFTLFESKGEQMNQAALVTHLGESIFVPSIFLQDYVTWEAIDNFHAKATIESKGIKASGIFTFNEKGELVKFETDDRVMDSGNGIPQKARWTVEADKYIESNGIKFPSELRAVWNLPEGDFVYFDGKVVAVDYDIR